MQVRKLELGSFRLFEDKSLDLEPGINFIVGENAQGKTTLLEALYLLMAGKSFRTSQWNDLIREGDSFFRLELHFEKWGIPQYLKIALQDSIKRIQYNSSKLDSLSGLLGIMQGVLLAPHDIELIRGVPAVRRHYLDFQIAQVDPLYIHHVVRCTKGVKHRNMMIRMGKMQAIGAYEEAIAEAATYIIKQRETAAEALSKMLKYYYTQISGKKEEVSLRYHSSLGKPDYESIIEKIRSQRGKDIELGYTSLGVHRDDLALHISGKAARNFASEGEMRSLAAALKLAEWERIRTMTKESPLLLVDDMGISLDSMRLNNLFEILSGFDQVVITSTSVFTSIKRSNCNIIKV